MAKRHGAAGTGSIRKKTRTNPSGRTYTYWEARFSNGLTKAGLSPKSIKNVHGVLHSCLAQAQANNYITSNPTKACKLPRIVKPEIRPLEPDEIKALLREAQLDDYCHLFTIALLTGCRQGELLGLSWDYVNFETGVITIRQQLQCKDGEYFLETPKNGKSRSILPARWSWRPCARRKRNSRRRRITPEPASRIPGIWCSPMP